MLLKLVMESNKFFGDLKNDSAATMFKLLKAGIAFLVLGIVGAVLYAFVSCGGWPFHYNTAMDACIDAHTSKWAIVIAIDGWVACWFLALICALLSAVGAALEWLGRLMQQLIAMFSKPAREKK